MNRTLLIRTTGALSLALMTAFSAWSPVWAREPLLMAGKKTLYERVLSRPGAVLKRNPGDGPGAQQAAMTRFYVYGRKTVDGTEWLEVGLTSKGKIDGWIKEGLTLPWKQQLALAFTNPANRDRALFFSERDHLAAVLEADEPAETIDQLRRSVQAGQPDPRVVSIEPETHVDIREKFYLLPIMSVEETFSGAGHRVRMLEVASVSADDGGAQASAQSAAQQAPPQASLLRNFRAAVVFVIDTTISMGPYIDRTREAVRAVYEKIEANGLSGQVQFGMVGFRSSLEASPKLEYVSRMYANPLDARSGTDFLAKVVDMSEARVSSHAFSEDAYAGVMTALEDVKWTEFGGRYIVLITDAGALQGNDKFSSTKLDAAQVRAEAAHRGVALYTLHLKTPQGRNNHSKAEQQYRELSQHPLVAAPLYYPVDAGDVGVFGGMVDTLADALVANVQTAAGGGVTVGSAQTASPNFGAKEEPPTNPQDRLRRDAAMLGHAMQLAYLGRTSGATAPPLFRAWISDRDPVQPEIPTTEVRVLLTRNQLSDMQAVLQSIAKTAEAARFEPAEFFNQMRSAAAVLGRDPNAINSPDATRIADLGLMGEYLEDLPYQSRALQLDQATWTSWSIGQQQAFIDEVSRKLRLYQIMHDDVDRWIALDWGADPGEAIYPVPLDLLP